MARLLTASDRSALIRLAASMPVGDKNRRSILTMLKQAMGPQAFAPVIRTFGDKINTPMEDRDVAVLTEAFVEMFQSYVARMIEIDSQKVVWAWTDRAPIPHIKRETFDYPSDVYFGKEPHNLLYTDILEGLHREAPPHLRDAIKNKHHELGEAMKVRKEIVVPFCSEIVLNVFNKGSHQSWYQDTASEYCRDNSTYRDIELEIDDPSLDLDDPIVDVEADRLVIHMAVRVSLSATPVFSRSEPGKWWEGYY